ncbi:MAG: SAM-dependent methyltransferase [Steroidobacteraceae bacterium]
MPPDLHESAHATRMLELLRARIAAAGGWLSFDSYMRIALYEPGLGYYSAGAHKLGAGGDFTTAPEISPLFGRCLGRHCVGVLQALGGGDVLELGAGSGRLAFDVLQTMALLGTLPDRYLILEISADLRDRQRQLLATLPATLAMRVEWLDAPPAAGWQGALLANEVLDALPVKRFVIRSGVWCELGVAMDAQGALHWSDRVAGAAFAAAIDARVAAAEVPEGYESELCPLVLPWVGEVTATLQRGVALFIDYGLPRRDYYSAQRNRGTLRCHYRQLAHDDPFAHPGMEDLTAWVDFTQVAEAADAAGLEVLGYATQAGALLGLGIENEIVTATDEKVRLRRAAEARQLLMPTEMGETFKFIALGRAFDAPLAGFVHQDLRRYL